VNQALDVDGRDEWPGEHRFRHLQHRGEGRREMKRGVQRTEQRVERDDDRVFVVLPVIVCRCGRGFSLGESGAGWGKAGVGRGFSPGENVPAGVSCSW
jgi:hypothetical protein